MTQTGPLTSPLSSSISSGEDSSASPLREEMSPLQAPASLLGLPLRGLGGVGTPSFGGVREEGRATVPPLGSRLPYFLVFCFYGSKMLEETRESVLSLTLGEVSTAKSQSAQRTHGAQGEEAFQTLGPPSGGGELVIPRLACMQTYLSPCWGCWGGADSCPRDHRAATESMAW